MFPEKCPELISRLGVNPDVLQTSDFELALTSLCAPHICLANVDVVLAVADRLAKPHFLGVVVIFIAAIGCTIVLGLIILGLIILWLIVLGIIM